MNYGVIVDSFMKKVGFEIKFGEIHLHVHGNLCEKKFSKKNMFGNCF